MIPAAAFLFSVATCDAETRIDVRWNATSIALPEFSVTQWVEVTTSLPSDAETPPRILAVTSDAERVLETVGDSAVAEQGDAVLSKIRRALKAFNVDRLPALRGRQHEDGSLTFEWRFPDRRLAFTIEHNPAESGWHLVSSRSSDGIRAYGGLSEEEDLRLLLGWALRLTQSA
jgi:hypothetical protein